MKIVKHLLCSVLVLMTISYVQAQSTPEARLAALEKRIAECTENIKDLESKLKASANLSGDLVQSAVANWSKQLEENKKCKKQAERDIETLRILFPSMFMPKSVVGPTRKPNKPAPRKDDKKKPGDIVEDKLNDLKNLVKKVGEMLQDFIDRHK